MNVQFLPLLALILIAVVAIGLLVASVVRYRIERHGNPRARVSLVVEGGAVTSVPFRNRRVRIGRNGKKNDLVVGADDDVVSREHAVVEYVGGRYFLRDRSMNGTMLNGRYMTNDEVISPGQTFIIPRSYHLQLVGPGESAASSSTTKGSFSSRRPLSSNDQFELGQSLKRGGQAAVWTATWRATGEKCVVKYLTNPDFETKFRQQIQGVQLIRHANCVRALGGNASASPPWLAEEYLSGGTLEDLMRSGHPIKTEEATHILSQACDGLFYLHNVHDIVHSDVSPSNIMFDSTGTLKLIDFGIAHFGNDPTFTLSGKDIYGKAKYLSPEQINLDAHTQATDIYALGVVAYQMLTGRVPFEGDVKEVMNAHIRQRPKSPSDVNTNVPKRISDVVMKALEKDPRNRFSSAQEMANALGRDVHLGGDAVPGEARYPLRLRDVARGILLPDIINSPCIIGREQIDPVDTTISVRHCRVEYLPTDGGAWYLINQENKNPTYVNGRSIGNLRVRLKPDDEISFGDRSRVLKVME